MAAWSPAASMKGQPCDAHTVLLVRTPAGRLGLVPSPDGHLPADDAGVILGNVQAYCAHDA